MTDTSTRFTEVVLEHCRAVEFIVENLVQVWISRHGTPSSLSDDDGFHNGAIIQLFSPHEVVFKVKSTRRHNKMGIVKRKTQTLKTIAKKLYLQPPTRLSELLIVCCVYLSKVFLGSTTLSSFQLAWEYELFFVGILSDLVSQELLDVHVGDMATRCIQRAVRARANHCLDPHVTHASNMIWVRYAPS